MNIEIKELKKEHLKLYNITEFLFKMIKENYDLEYVPEYHYDIKNLNKYYIKPNKNNFYIVINKSTDEIIGTAGIRSYDRIKNVKNRQYSKETTASIYRVFVEKKYRHKKIATMLIHEIEKFCKNNNYTEIYLHTQKNSYGALSFWLNMDYTIVHDTHDELGTIHMEKILKKDFLISSLTENQEKIES